MDLLQRSAPFELDPTHGDGLTLAGYAAVFNSKTRIDSWEGLFDEQIAPGAFAKTLRERTPVLQFDHGQHPLLGSIPIGTIKTAREEDRGLFVEARLHDNWLTEPVRDAIGSGAVDGMSFRFSVPPGKDDWDRSGTVPLRTIYEVRCVELGPVVFPAYADTTVAVRSLLANGDLEHLDDEVRAELEAELRAMEPAPTFISDAFTFAPNYTLSNGLIRLVTSDATTTVTNIRTLDESTSQPAAEDEPGTVESEAAEFETEPPPESTPSVHTREAAYLRLLKLRSAK